MEKFRDQVDGEFIRLIYLTSPLHDIGKVGIPDCVLLNPGRLNDREFEIMKTHALLGAETFDAALRTFPGTCNHYFTLLPASWRERNKPAPRLLRVRVAQRFARISCHMVAGRSVFNYPNAAGRPRRTGRAEAHPAAQGRDYLLRKLITFHREHETPALDVQRDLHTALEQMNPKDRAAEAAPLREELQRVQQHARGPQPLADILPIVLASISILPDDENPERKEVKPEPSMIQSPASGSSGPA